MKTYININKNITKERKLLSTIIIRQNNIKNVIFNFNTNRRKYYILIPQPNHHIL
jgi:hypothetical protein